MSTEMVVYDAIQKSNLPSREKSLVRQWFERTTGTTVTRGGVIAGSAMFEAGRNLRQGAESGVVGGTLGAVHAMADNGLDTKAGVPIDGALAALGMIGSVVAQALGAGEIAPELRNMGTTSLGVFSFRKSYDMIAAKRGEKGLPVGGSFGPQQAAKVAGERGDFAGDFAGDSSDGADPIVAAAAALGD